MSRRNKYRWLKFKRKVALALIISLTIYASALCIKNNVKKQTTFLSPISVATVSATFNRIDERPYKLARFFKKYNSPLVDNVDHFIEYADKFGFDYKIVPAIAGVESTFCKNYVKETNNCFGYLSSPGHLWSFTSIELAIRKVSWQIGTTSYYKKWQKDQENISLLADVYNEGDEKKWESGVRYFIKEIDEL